MIRKDSNYYDTSLEIVKEFIQTVTIVDDKAQFVTDESGSTFDAGRIIKQFAEDGKICSVFKFTEKEDVEKIIRIARKSDITILDWKIELPESSGIEANDELEEDENNSKGFYTLKILKEIISSEYNSLKLFVIYTDEVELNRIADEIKKELAECGIQTQEETPSSPYSFYSNNNKICIFGKEEVKTKATHVKEIAERSYNYEELAEVIYDEFLHFTHGVVAGIFLKAIASIRTNTYLLLNTFQRDIDAAFITHKGLLPIPDDAHDHIIELIGSEMKCVMSGALNEATTNSLIETFIDSFTTDAHLQFNIDTSSLPNNHNIPTQFSIDNFKTMLNKGLISFCNYEDESAKSKIDLSQKASKHLPKIIIQSDNPTLNSTNINQKAKRSNIDFAKLTTLKNRYLKFNKPILTLGVILKGCTISGKDEYWICIQPKCDSVRIQENERSFLFLSLSKANTNGDIILDARLGFKINYSIPKAKQFMFRPTENGMVCVRENESNGWFFLDSFGRRFEYLCELKNDFVQSIANNFASQVSRVAVNHSEWLRLQADK